MKINRPVFIAPIHEDMNGPAFTPTNKEDTMTQLMDHMTMPQTVSPRSVAGHIMHTINPRSQNGKVLLHLIKAGSISQLVALELYRVHRLASRITDLKHIGVPVRTNYRVDLTGARYAEYSL